MTGENDKGTSNDLDLDVKKTGPTITSDNAGELADKDLNKVAGGRAPLRTITCDEECDSYACMESYA